MRMGVAGLRERFMQRSVCIRNSRMRPVFIDIRRDISSLLFDFTLDAGTQTPGLLVAFSSFRKYLSIEKRT